jgi:hypothetical protein
MTALSCDFTSRRLSIEILRRGEGDYTVETSVLVGCLPPPGLGTAQMEVRNLDDLAGAMRLLIKNYMDTLPATPRSAAA